MGLHGAPAAALAFVPLGRALPSRHDAIPAPQAQGSFFSRLSAVHYAGAAVVLLLLIGGAIAVPVMLLRGGASKAAANANAASDIKSDAQKPDVITMPAQPAQQATLPPPAPSNSGSAAGAGGELAPVAGGTTKEERPAAPVRQAPPVQKAAPPAAKPKPDKSRAEKLLTGN